MSDTEQNVLKRVEIHEEDDVEHYYDFFRFVLPAILFILLAAYGTLCLFQSKRFAYMDPLAKGAVIVVLVYTWIFAIQLFMFDLTLGWARSVFGLK